MLILKNISAKVVEATGVTPWDMVLYVLDENLFVLKNFQVLLGSFLYYNIQSKGNTKQRLAMDQRTTVFLANKLFTELVFNTAYIEGVNVRRRLYWMAES